MQRFGNDWSATWDQIRALAADALVTLREGLEPLLPDQ